MKIWDTRSGESIKTLEGHSRFARSVAFSHNSTQLASASDDKTVKIWDMRNGKRQQTLGISKTVWNISFDTTGSYLHTEVGAININASSSSTIAANEANPENPLYKGWTLSSDGSWITFNSMNCVWLPSEYRPSSSAVSGTKIGIGLGSGNVWIYNFKADDTQDLGDLCTDE